MVKGECLMFFGDWYIIELVMVELWYCDCILILIGGGGEKKIFVIVVCFVDYFNIVVVVDELLCKMWVLVVWCDEVGWDWLMF